MLVLQDRGVVRSRKDLPFSGRWKKRKGRCFFGEVVGGEAGWLKNIMIGGVWCS